MTLLRTTLTGALVGLALVARASPADRLPRPRPEPCIPFDADPAEGEMVAPNGRGYEEVTQALDRVIQTALECEVPADRHELHLTFELVVGCNGLVSAIEASDDDGEPAAYVKCVADVIARADFPAHDVADGMPITYPVNVEWE